MKSLCFIWLFFPKILFAQISLSGVVVGTNNQILPWSNIVLLSKNIGTLTNEKGVFTLSNILLSDSIKITNIAFLPKVVAIIDLQKNDTIRLTQSIPQLKNVVIQNFAKYNNVINVGIFGNPSNGEFAFGPGQQIATYIDNDKRSEGWIKSLYFNVKKFGKCKNSMRVRLLRADTFTFKPTIDFLPEAIIIQSADLKQTNEIDLSGYKIMLPREGVFIVLEWLYPDTVCDKNSYTTIGANLYMLTDFVYFNFRDREWIGGHRPRMNDGNYMTPDVWLKVGY